MCCVFLYLKGSCSGDGGSFPEGTGTSCFRENSVWTKGKQEIFIRAIQHRNWLPTKWWKLIFSLKVLKTWLNWALENLVYGPPYKRRLDLGLSRDLDFSMSPQLPEFSLYDLVVFKDY